MQAWQVDSKNAILASNSCLREIEIRRDFEDTLEPPTPEFLDEILASLSATTVRSFTPNDDAICIDREFKVFFFDRGQFNLDDQVPIFRDVNVGIDCAEEPLIPARSAFLLARPPAALI